MWRVRWKPRCTSCTSWELIFAALCVVTTKNVVHAALWLIVVLGGVAAQYILAAAEFVAVSQVRFDALARLAHETRVGVPGQVFVCGMSVVHRRSSGRTRKRGRRRSGGVGILRAALHWLR